MSVARYAFAAVLLPSGKVLLIGGASSQTADTASVDVFDPATNRITPAAPMATPRQGHTATLLPNGSVLVTGGAATVSLGALATTEIYDPATDTWSAAAPMPHYRENHLAVALKDGKVVVAGGWGGPYGTDPTDFEVYDAATDKWSSSPPTVFGGRPTGPVAVLLQDGRVMVDDGLGVVVPGGPEFYDPSTGRTTVGRTINPSERSAATAAVLPDGTVLIAGGYATFNATGPLASTDVYDPVHDTWQAGPVMNVARCGHTMTTLKNGRILVSGGSCTYGSAPIREAELYDPSTKKWWPAASMPDPLAAQVAVLLADGRVLVAGGAEDGSAGTEIYSPA